jgi:hypothetical protein
LQRTVATTREDADIVLSTDAADEARLYDSPAECARELAHGPRAYGLVRQERFARSFAAEHWQVLGRAGDFLLISNRPEHGASSPVQCAGF